MRAVAIDAGGHVRIAFADQGSAMNTIFIQVIDLRMALLTGLRDLAAGLVGYLDVMRTVAIRADGCILVALLENDLVCIVGHCRFLGSVALGAQLVGPDGEIPA